MSVVYSVKGLIVSRFCISVLPSHLLGNTFSVHWENCEEILTWRFLGRKSVCLDKQIMSEHRLRSSRNSNHSSFIVSLVSQMDGFSQHTPFWMLSLSLSCISRASFQNIGYRHMTQSFAIQQIQWENIGDKLSSKWTIFICFHCSSD